MRWLFGVAGQFIPNYKLISPVLWALPALGGYLKVLIAFNELLFCCSGKGGNSSVFAKN